MIKECARFCDLFSGDEYASEGSSSEQRGRKIIASLVPGNHDLGFATGVQPSVKDRFDAYFGPINLVDVVGNHAIVTLDRVSLSAVDQADPSTSSSGFFSHTFHYTDHQTQTAVRIANEAMPSP